MDVAVCYNPCASHKAGKEMVWNIGPVNEAQSAITFFVCLIIRKEYELRQLYHLIFTGQRFATKK
jgi:hypothetical protein